ncbi:hypothetical protein L2E82_45546 [Cichorium intybus]|uniref:Uncharacterized protein n=1 Tax=Cichorium intybus TaxID=13427 RepID=A0ACB8ZU66_CICIN|nr:hypothetical protein L2E82_45546 [Cichorium intybus]
MLPSTGLLLQLLISSTFIILQFPIIVQPTIIIHSTLLSSLIVLPDEPTVSQSPHKMLEQEYAFFFNMKYFEEQVQAGEWDEYLEALDRNDRAKAVEILVKDLKVFSTFNEELFKEITQLLTLENFRQNEQLLNSLSGPVPKASVFPPIGAHGPFQPVVSPSAGWMASANLSMHRAGVPAGPLALVQPPVTAAFLKHPRTPPGGGPGLEYHMAESEHLMKRARLGPSDE